LIPKKRHHLQEGRLELNAVLSVVTRALAGQVLLIDDRIEGNPVELADAAVADLLSLTAVVGGCMRCLLAPLPRRHPPISAS
jgi:hypothetical protein